MELAEIERKVKDIIIDHLGVEESAVTPEARFTHDLNADSLDTVELMIKLEKELGVQVPEEDSDKVQTVGSLIAYVKEKLG